MATKRKANPKTAGRPSRFDKRYVNPKRERFCQEYVIDHKGGPAYVRAGYSKNGADQGAERLLRIVEISARVAELDAKILQRLEITQESVLREIEETRVAALAAEQHATALKAAELKGKHIGMWPQKAEVNLNLIEKLNDAEQRIVEAALAAIARDKGEDAEGPAPTHH